VSRLPWSRLWIVAALTIVTLTIFAQVRAHEFLLYDDPEYVTNNREVRAGLTWHGFLWSFQTFAAGNWHPLTWISHMLDVQLFGVDSGAHHLVNVALHLLAAMLLFVFLARATGSQWKSAFVALAFAIHPLHVESVAWVAERKDVLSGLFVVLSLGAYLSYASQPTLKRYLLVVVAFAMALMAKPTAVTFPALMLLVDIWPLGRLRLWDKLPLFLMSGVAATLTFVAQRSSGAVSSIYVLSPAERFGNAALSYAVYLRQFFWPVKLAVFYPYLFGRPLWPTALAILILICVSAAAIAVFRRAPAVTVGWFWYIISLVPMVGLVQVGAQAHADRYVYIPSIGLGILLAWGVGEMAKAWPPRRTQPAVAGVVVTVGCIWGTLAWNYTKDWHDTITLFSHAIAAGQDSVVARHQLGIAFKQSGELDRAIDEFEHSVRLSPDSVDERHALGKALLAAGRPSEAATQLTAAVRMAPREALMHTDLATALMQSGNVTNAIVEYGLAVQCDPSNADAHAGYGGALMAVGRVPEALSELKKALPVLVERVASNPDDGNAHYDLGTYYAYTEQSDKAIGEFSEVIRLRPRDVDAHFNLGITMAARGRYQEAVGQFAEAIQLDPSRGRTHLFLGKCLVALKRYDEAESEFRNAVRLDPNLAKSEPALRQYLR
jgi:protein O-mannosyl-transferase